MQKLGKGKWVFIDWMGIWPGYGTDPTGRDLPYGFLMPAGIELKPHKPKVVPEAVLAAEYPWEARGVHGFATFLEDQGRFRCWYPVPLGNDLALAHAESEDGVLWKKPMLGLQAHAGSTQNNFVALESRGGAEQSHHVFIDPVAPAAERYKMVSSCERLDQHGLFGAVSTDGLRWSKLPGDPVILKNRGDTHNIGAYDEESGKYVIFTRQRDMIWGRRGVNRAESPDFHAFPLSEPILESSPLDPPDWDYYTSGYSRWPGAVNAHVMRFTVYHHSSDTVDVHLAVSRDGKVWHRPMGREAWVDGGADGSTPHGSIYACAGILRTAPGEWSSYLGVYPQTHYQALRAPPRSPGKILRAVIREDGLMSLSSSGHGEFFTIPFQLASAGIRINARAGTSGYVRCAILAADGGAPDPVVKAARHPVPVYRGFTLDDCVPVKGDHCDIPLVWKDDIRRLRGREIQLHVELFNADIYALNFA